MADLNDQRSLRTFSEAFKELAATVDSQTADVEIATFSSALSLISRLSLLWPRLQVCGDQFGRQGIIANTVKKVGSHSRILLKIKCGANMVRVLFENILATGCHEHASEKGYYGNLRAVGRKIRGDGRSMAEYGIGDLGISKDNCRGQQWDG
ncbi:hypothetical protein CJ030_MR3G022594 [Morella rubra]|uniref:Uncharacterized protein n=1 Tax=Morella rubra TaxID=262757 RepID=A0A6A1W6N1_9ROSI|nr:hypothetical protein CJ030_MR3G022592 [Morella rubra]KAB1220882.1 hypothetical protein CJ030_MR3G022594 [Morella rubra]